ncbi:hypothetical protein V6B16_05325 [Salinimicrobium catena]|uniref:hypothetical protein n=1 Tax=Salinimicrobium catena TaxID=390640 RepID=UPI002FE4B73B
MKQFYLFLLLLLVPFQYGFAQANEEKAIVYFARAGFQGSAINLHIFTESGYQGAIRGNNTIKAEMDPGEQQIVGAFPAGHMTTTFSMDLEPGKTYYVVGKLNMFDPTDFLFDASNDQKLLKKAKKKVEKGDFQVVSSTEKREYEEKYEDRWAHILTREQEEVDHTVQLANAQKAAKKAATITAPEDMATIHFAHVGIVAEHIELPIFHGNQYIGSIKGKNTITYKTPPGDLSFTGVYSEVNFASTVNIAALPGSTHYLQADLNGGAYKMEASPDGKLTHFFLTDVTGEQEKQMAVKKLLSKKNSLAFSEAKKTELEQSYGKLVQSTTNFSAGASEYLADATAGPSTGDFTSSTTATSDAPVEYGANKREIAYKEILKSKEKGDSYTTAITVPGSSVIEEEGEIEKVKHSEDNTEAGLKYRRSSLYTMMINDTERLHFDAIRDAFGNFELSEKFNDHNIGPYLIDAEGGEKDQSDVITAYLNENGVARDLVAKWFGRNDKGEFTMDLVASRGSYNASDLDVLIAKDSKRGEALLADAGEELIGNTFLIVNDYKYVNKEEVAQKASGVLSFVSDVASIAGYDGVALAADAANVGATVMGKGYVVKTTSYLYRLVWNDEIANEFYSNLWMDNRNYDPAKKEAFETSDLFKLRLVGSQSAWADLQSTAFTKKSDQDLIKKATVRATNKGISKLQRKFEEFRTKSPLLSGDPISAKIGLKEGLEKGDKFEVLEQVIDENGRTHYKRVGKIKVDPNHIWDNTLYDEESEESSTSEEEYTVFKGKRGKYYSGMLIRQIN